jgi:hypothetical protein
MGIISPEGVPEFPLGIYEQPRDARESRDWKRAGINLLRCGSNGELDRAQDLGMMGWVPVRMVVRDDPEASALAETIKSMRGHPALAVWEAPDESIWEACRLASTGKVNTRIWSENSDVRRDLRGRLDALVEGLARGSRIVRKLDRGRKIWLNEACKSDQDTLARLLGSVDAVGFDYYPIPRGEAEGRSMRLIGGYTDRFRRTAPNKELWVVEQAFSWSSIRPESGRPQAYPNVEEYRFMAWDAIAHGATGLLWWGSAHEDRPAPFLEDLMAIVSELNQLQPYLVAGNAPRVRIGADPRQNPEIAGVTGLVRRSGPGTLMALINEDPHENDVVVRGLDWASAEDFTPLAPGHSGFASTTDGWITTMKGEEVRILLAE